MSNDQQEDLYGEDSPQHVGNGPATQPAPTRMDNISAMVKGAKTGKVMLVTAAVVVLAVALVAVALTSTKKKVLLPASVSGVSVGQTPGLQDQTNKDLVDSRQYTDMVAQVNAGRASDAARNGTSVQPLADGTARTLVAFKTPAEEERDAKIAAELAASKAAGAALEVQIARLAAQQLPAQQQPQQPQQVDPAYTAMLNNANQAMGELLAPRGRGTQSFEVSAAPKIALASPAAFGNQAGSMSGAGAAALASVATASRGKTLIPAGAVVVAKMDTAVNTDIGGDFVATLVTGPWAGAKLIGTSTRVGELASLQFKVMSFPGDGVSIPVTAVALNSESLEAGVATDVDRKLLVKYGVKPLVAGVAAVGQALLAAGTKVAISGVEVVTTKPSITKEQAQNIVIGSAAQQVNADANALNTTPTVRVAPGTVIGIMFTADVVYTAK